MSDAPEWLDDLAPLPDEDAAAQRESLEALLAPGPRRVLDLGCGAGRILVPLRTLGHHVVGLDRHAGALEACRTALGTAGLSEDDLLETDFVDDWVVGGPPFDAVLCLGNTMMTVSDPDDAVTLLGHVFEVLRPGGVFVMDDVPGWYWSELADGRWSSGTSEDDELQLVWADDDAVFTLRSGDDVDPEDWTLRDDEVHFRLWTMGALCLALRAAGLSAERPQRWRGLLVVRRPGGGAADQCPG